MFLASRAERFSSWQGRRVDLRLAGRKNKNLHQIRIKVLQNQVIFSINYSSTIINICSFQKLASSATSFFFFLSSSLTRINVKGNQTGIYANVRRDSFFFLEQHQTDSKIACNPSQLIKLPQNIKIFSTAGLNLNNNNNNNQVQLISRSKKEKEKENGMQSMKKFYVPNSQILKKKKITINYQSKLGSITLSCQN